MTIQKQKRLLFIPYVNYVVILIQWLLLYFRHPIPKIGMLKVGLKNLLCDIVITGTKIMWMKMVSNTTVDLIIDLIGSYLSLLVVSLILLKDQQRYYNSRL